MRFQIIVSFVIFLVFGMTKTIESAKILVMAPFFGKSHSIFINSIVSELTNKGHDVVLFTSNKLKDPPSNLRQIVMNDDDSVKIDPNEMYERVDLPNIFSLLFIWDHTIRLTESYLSSKGVQDFMKEKDNQFDVVISELFFQEAFYMFAHKYKAPLILLSSSIYMQSIDNYMGHESTLSYLSHELTSHYGDLTLQERISNFIIGKFMTVAEIFYQKRAQQNLAEQYFPDLPRPLPRIADIEKNISLVLLNTHYSFDSIRPLVPGVVEIGGVHIKAPKPLPKDMKAFLDEAKNGAIYFSLGSFLQSSKMPEATKNIFFNVFKTLKQRVLWKWENETLPEDIPNVMISKWMPQSDVLAHPNVRLFISHGGMLGTQEAIHRGVPVLGITVYGDQHLNMARLSHREMALHFSFTDITEEKLSKAINTILNDPKYAENAKIISQRYHDQQNTPAEKTSFWIEYVIRHKGADFMKSKLVNLPLYKHYFLDVYFIIFVIIIGVFLGISTLLKSVRIIFVEGFFSGLFYISKVAVTVYSLGYVSYISYSYLINSK